MSVLAFTWANAGLCRWQTFGASDGVPTGFIESMLEDRSGSLWVATPDVPGVTRFDGVTWQSYAPAGSAEGTVRMIEDSAGRI